MARKNVIEFVVKLIDDASKDLKKLEGGFKQFAATIIKRGAMVATAVVALGGVFLSLYKNMTKAYAEFDRFSESLGMSVESLSQLEYAARQTGVGITTLKNAMENMSPAIDNAADGVGVAADAIAELGLDAEKLNALGMEDQFLVLADAFSKLESETRAVILSQDVFGDGASEIYRILKGGSGAIREYAKEADQLGITIQGKASKEARLFREELSKLELTSRKLQQVIITELGPAIRQLAGWILEVAEAAGEWYDKFAMHYNLGTTTLPMLEYQYKLLQSAMNTFVETVADGDAAIAKSMPAYQRMARQLESVAGAMKFYNDEAAKGVSKGLVGGTTPDASAGPFQPLEEIATQFPELTGIITKRRKGDTDPEWKKQADAEEKAIMDRYKRILEEHQRVVRFMESLADQAARGIQTAMADFFFDPFSEGLDGMLKQFINVIRRMIAEWLAFQAVTALGIPGFFSSTLGLGKKASGGHVTAGNPYIVGERGPELFIPGASGSIIPNNKSGMGGMNFVTNIDARGADPGLIARLPQIMEQRDRQLMLKMKDYFETGGLAL